MFDDDTLDEAEIDALINLDEIIVHIQDDKSIQEVPKDLEDFMSIDDSIILEENDDK